MEDIGMIFHITKDKYKQSCFGYIVHSFLRLGNDIILKPITIE